FFTSSLLHSIACSLHRWFNLEEQITGCALLSFGNVNPLNRASHGSVEGLRPIRLRQHEQLRFQSHLVSLLHFHIQNLAFKRRPSLHNFTVLDGSGLFDRCCCNLGRSSLRKPPDELGEHGLLFLRYPLPGNGIPLLRTGSCKFVLEKGVVALL
ncbi:hypothetical protein PMAYCL1PPCAC_09807, partial [Pristionchus mayeri]